MYKALAGKLLSCPKLIEEMAATKFEVTVFGAGEMTASPYVANLAKKIKVLDPL